MELEVELSERDREQHEVLASNGSHLWQHRRTRPVVEGFATTVGTTHQHAGGSFAATNQLACMKTRAAKLVEYNEFFHRLASAYAQGLGSGRHWNELNKTRARVIADYVCELYWTLGADTDADGLQKPKATWLDLVAGLCQRNGFLY